MIVVPAIDIMDGAVVRLVRGDFAEKTVFSQDPVAAVTAIASAGACCLHLVDLSGARDPRARQHGLLRRVVEASPLRVQLGGGIRETAEIEQLLALGADRIVLGSLVVNSPLLALEALSRFGADRLTFALDVRLEGTRPVVMRHGWTESSGLDFAQAIAPFLERGLKRVLCTDIDVDGRLVGPNLGLYRSLRSQFPALELQASGGVSSLEDLRALAAAGVHSVVVGRALLAGHFTLAEALNYAQ